MKVDSQAEYPKAAPNCSRSDAAATRRRLPIGAEPAADGGVHFRVWAPKASDVTVELLTRSHSSPRSFKLSPEADGYFAGHVSDAQPGMLYRYKLPSGSFPDPASRFQPEGTHGPSLIVDPRAYTWADGGWKGAGRRGQVIYEMHIGTFTREGTWAAAQQELGELAKLGITVLEVMPVAEFPGKFGWGYDGVDLFAPTRLYGQPDDFRRFVDHAHQLGLAVILDVVYNHFGPDGNFLKEFSDHYFTTKYKNEWGEPINFDGDHCGPVREFFCANARYWVEEYHLDGLRLDATQQIYDSSPENIHRLIHRSVREAAGDRNTLIVAENEPQDAILVRQTESGGYGLDALWNDDFHHTAVVALGGRADAYYSDYVGSPQELISSIKRGFIYQGQRSGWQSNPRGTWSFDLGPEQFVNYLQNHDQVANSLSGLRIHQASSPGCLRALTALLLLGPATPMLFQGQEFAASSPFLYFADHNPELSRLVADGRKSFLSQFTGIANPESADCLAVPHDPETFNRCKLDFSDRLKHKHVYQLHRDLLSLRKMDPVFSNPHRGGVDGAVLGTQTFVLRFFGESGEDRLLLINLGSDFPLTLMAEPLLAPGRGPAWELAWSSESPQYGGAGTPSVISEETWRIPGHSAVVLAPSRSGHDPRV